MKMNTKKLIYRITALVVLIFVALGMFWGSGSAAPKAYAAEESGFFKWTIPRFWTI